MIVADTDVLIDYMHGAEPAASRIALELKSRAFTMTAVTAFELWVGAKTPRTVALVESLFAAMTILPLDEEGARRGAEVRRALLAGGNDIGMADCLIAGICLTNGALLLTNNRRHFERVDGLLLARLA